MRAGQGVTITGAIIIIATAMATIITIANILLAAFSPSLRIHLSHSSPSLESPYHTVVDYMGGHLENSFKYNNANSTSPTSKIGLIGFWNYTLHHFVTVAIDGRNIVNTSMLENDTRQVIMGDTDTSSSHYNNSKREYSSWNDLISVVDKSANKVPYLRMADNTSSVDILVILTNEPNDQALGRTKVTLGENHEIVFAEITIFDADNLYERGQFSAVLKHEIGHALGLSHSTADDSVMHSGLLIENNKEAGQIGSCEFSGMLALYSDVKTHGNVIPCN